TKVELDRSLSASVSQYERHLHVDAVGDDPAVLDFHFLFLDPGAADIFQCLVGALDPLFESVLKADLGRCSDFGDTGDRHGFLLATEHSPPLAAYRCRPPATRRQAQPLATRSKAISRSRSAGMSSSGTMFGPSEGA